jgi:hypothetical protein
MSYCRFSSDDFSCDVYVYVYADVAGGWTTHVAGNRPVGDIPKELPFPQPGEDVQAWLASHKAQHEWLMACERAPIGLPHDGETFNDPTPATCRDRLIALRALGYVVPQYAIDELDEEAREGAE